MFRIYTYLFACCMGCASVHTYAAPADPLQEKITPVATLAVTPEASSAISIPPSTLERGTLSIEQLEQAAQAGDPDAQYALGYLYYQGKEVPQDMQASLNWIKRASVQGQAQAIEAVRLLAPETPPASVDKEEKFPTTTTAALSKEQKNSPPKAKKKKRSKKKHHGNT